MRSSKSRGSVVVWLMTVLVAVLVAVLAVLVGLLVEAPGAQASTPVAPVVVGPANGASVLVPFTISWSPVSDPMLTVSPDKVTGGTPATGTITLPSAAPAGGTVVTLSSDLPLSATTPASVTVPAGAKSAQFTVTTFPVDVTTVLIFATNGGTTLNAPLGITVAPSVPGTGQVVTVTATGRSGVSIVSSPADLNVPVGTSAGAQFTGAVRLSATDGRDVIWSGACSSAGQKVKTCRFTPTGPSAVTANVQ